MAREIQFTPEPGEIPALTKAFNERSPWPAPWLNGVELLPVAVHPVSGRITAKVLDQDDDAETVARLVGMARSGLEYIESEGDMSGGIPAFELRARQRTEAQRYIRRGEELLKRLDWRAR